MIMTKKINSLVIFLICSIAAFAQPTNNPIKEFYQDSAIGYPGWTDEVNWLNVHVMSDQGSGSANFAYFQTKCLDVYNEGGGVLYYPAGTYEFDIPDSPNGEGLMLMEGVVIRGATPSSDLSAVTNRDISSSLVT